MSLSIKFLAFFSIIIYTLSSTVSYASRIDCNPRKVFSGRFFGIAKQVLLFKNEDKNYRYYENKRNEIFYKKRKEISKICRLHRALIREVNTKSISYPKITQSKFYELYHEKVNKVLSKYLKNEGSYQKATAALVQQLKRIGFPHRPDQNTNEIYFNFSQTIETQIVEELRQQQITQLKNILFGKFDQFLHLYDINKEVAEIQKILKTPIVSSGNKFQNLVKKYNLKNLISSTKYQEQNIDQLDKSIEYDFIQIAQKGLKKSMGLYVKFIIDAKEAETKLKLIKEKRSSKNAQILELLYLARINNEHARLTFINLDFYSTPVFSISGLKNFAASHSYIKNNCPYLYKAINLRLDMIIKDIFKIPYFSQVKVSWKSAPYNEIYNKAIQVVKNKLYKSRQNDFLNHHRLNN